MTYHTTLLELLCIVYILYSILQNTFLSYYINVLQQTACLVVAVGNFALLFNSTLVGQTSDSMTVQI